MNILYCWVLRGQGNTRDENRGRKHGRWRNVAIIPFPEFFLETAKISDCLLRHAVHSILHGHLELLVKKDDGRALVQVEELAAHYVLPYWFKNISGSHMSATACSQQRERSEANGVDLCFKHIKVPSQTLVEE